MTLELGLYQGHLQDGYMTSIHLVLEGTRAQISVHPTSNKHKLCDSYHHRKCEQFLTGKMFSFNSKTHNLALYSTLQK